MKKIISILCLILCFSFIFCFGCKQKNPLVDCVSELRCDIFEGKSQNFSIKCSYGFKETPYKNDALVGQKVYMLCFRLLDKELDGATYVLSFDFNGQTYTKEFKLNPVSHAMTCEIEVDDFNLKQFPIKVSYGSITEEINLLSILPEKTIDYLTALNYLYNDQKNLINAYIDKDGNFKGEIYVRVIVKNQHPYYYVGIASGADNLKALLIDGLTPKVLAIREIF